MRHYSLQSRWDTVAVHCACSLPASALCSLCVWILLRLLLLLGLLRVLMHGGRGWRRLLNHGHLLTVRRGWLRWIWRRCTLV